MNDVTVFRVHQNEDVMTTDVKTVTDYYFHGIFFSVVLVVFLVRLGSFICHYCFSKKIKPR